MWSNEQQLKQNTPADTVRGQPKTRCCCPSLPGYVTGQDNYSLG